MQSGRKPDVVVAVAAGYGLAAAVKGALDGGIAGFAARHGFPRPNVSMCLSGAARCERIRAALASELGISREWFDNQLDALKRDRRENRPGQLVTAS